MQQSDTQYSQKRSRSKRRREARPIAPKEKFLVGLACSQVGLAIWAIALTHIWSQVLFTSLSLIGFVICLLPQQRDLRFQDMEQTTSAVLSRLLRFPIFWSGLLLLIYILIQALNPAYGYKENPQVWEAFPIDHISWLPSSLAGPFYKINAWRLMMMLGSGWLFLCYTWVGLNRRRSLVFLLWFIFINAIAFCFLAVIQKQMGAKGIYWNFPVFPHFFASVPYKNRGATLLYLMMGSSMALYFYHARAMKQKMLKSGPHLIVLLGILIQYGTLWTSFSRGGLAVSTSMLLLFFVMIFFTSFEEGDSKVLKWGGIIAMITLIVSAAIAVPRLPDVQKSLKRFNTVGQEIQSGDWNARGPTTMVTLEMIQDNMVFGWGAGSWRFIFPYYQQKYPEITYRGKTKLIWDDAHNDWAQYASELGLVGTPFLVFAMIWPLGYFLWRIRRSRCTHWIMAATLMGVFLHSVIELLFQNLAILCMVTVIILMLGRLPWASSRRKRE